MRVLPKLDSLDPGTLDLGAYLFATEQEPLPQEHRARQAPGTGGRGPRAHGPAAARGRPAARDPPRRPAGAGAASERRPRPAAASRARAPRARRPSYAEIGELVGLKENAVAQHTLARASACARSSASSKSIARSCPRSARRSSPSFRVPLRAAEGRGGRADRRAPQDLKGPPGSPTRRGARRRSSTGRSCRSRSPSSSSGSTMRSPRAPSGKTGGTGCRSWGRAVEGRVDCRRRGFSEPSPLQSSSVPASLERDSEPAVAVAAVDTTPPQLVVPEGTLTRAGVRAPPAPPYRRPPPPRMQSTVRSR